MRYAVPICRNELQRYFATPIGWVFVCGSCLLFGLTVYAAYNDSLRYKLLMPICELTFFKPLPEELQHPVILVVGLARAMALILIPTVAMRLFPEDKQTRTIEMLLTSPIHENEIVIGKWLGAVSLYLLILTISVIELGISSLWHSPNWAIVFITYTALIFLGGGVLSLGEWISTLTKHQSAAAAGTLLVCLLVLRFFDQGVLDAGDVLLCSGITVLGWLLSCRSIRALREAF
jgi:ABC-2 type transport system permease protein